MKGLKSAVEVGKDAERQFWREGGKTHEIWSGPQTCEVLTEVCDPWDA